MAEPTTPDPLLEDQDLVERVARAIHRGPLTTPQDHQFRLGQARDALRVLLSSPAFAARDERLRDDAHRAMKEEILRGANGRPTPTLSGAALALAEEVTAETRARLDALAARWDRQEYQPGAFYPEATAYADGRDAQAQACAEDLRDALTAQEEAPDA